MKIEHYIIYGGNDLNDPPSVTSGFPADAASLFSRWVGSICWRYTEDVNFIEVPATSNYRLLIRPYWDSRRFSRTVCYYVGFLIGKAEYISAGEYYVMSQGVASITLDQVLDAELRPISFRKGRCPKTAIWKPFEQLAGTEAIGCDEVQFKAKYEELCFSVSINNIDDWFGRLAIAVNPQYRYPGLNYYVSKRVLSDNVTQRITARQCRPSLSELNKSNAKVAVDQKGKGRILWCMLGLLLSIGIAVGGTCRYQQVHQHFAAIVRTSYERVKDCIAESSAALKNERQQSQLSATKEKEAREQIESLKGDMETLKQKCADTARELRGARDTIKKLEENNKELLKSCSDKDKVQRERDEFSRRNKELRSENDQLKDENGKLEEQCRELKKDREARTNRNVPKEPKG